MRESNAARAFEAMRAESDRTMRAELERGLASREAMQREQRLSGEEDLSDELSVGFELRKGEKRDEADAGEDMLLVDKETGLTGVFDGLGGEGKGDTASGYAAERMPGIYKDVAKGLRGKFEGGTGDPLAAERQAFFEGQASLEHPSRRVEALAQIQEMWKGLPTEVKLEMLSFYEAVKKLDAEVRKTGGKSTITVGKSIPMPDGRMFEVVANVGDGGAMKLREDGTAREITKEDSLVDALLQRGMLTPEDARNPDFEIKPLKGMRVRDARRQMVQALGGDGVTPRVTVDLVRPGEKVIYMTDGLRDEMVDDKGDFVPEKAAKLFDPKKSAKENAERMGAEAAKGPKHDDKAVLVKERFMTAEVEEEVVELSDEDIEAA